MILTQSKLIESVRKTVFVEDFDNLIKNLFIIILIKEKYAH